MAELRDGTPVKVTDRTAAERLVNTRLYVDRAQLPEPDAEEFYVADLIGMAAIDAAGKVLGAVATVHDYGAGASLEIVRDGAPPLLVPFTRACDTGGGSGGSTGDDRAAGGGGLAEYGCSERRQRRE